MKTKIIIISIVAILLGAMAWVLVNNKQEINARKEIRTTEERISVTVATAELKATDGTLQLTGKAEPYKEVTVVSETSGRVVQLNFKMGDFVNRGAILARVDDTYKRLAHESAQINYRKFKEDYERFQILHQGEAVTENQLHDMRIGYEMAKIQLETATKQLDDTKIIAPFSGYITSRNTELGAFVGMGTPIAEISDIARLKVRLIVSESNVYQLYNGMEANVTTNIFPDIQLKGNISGIGVRGSNTHTYPVEILINNNSQKTLKAGTFVNVTVNVGNDDKLLMIPHNAIVSSVREPSVYVVKDDVVQLTRITVGNSYNGYLEVFAGINEGDKVVTSGQINLSDNAQVSVIYANQSLKIWLFKPFFSCATGNVFVLQQKVMMRKILKNPRSVWNVTRVKKN
jgi:RND family efflux transporter MFP subunit